MCEAVGRRNSRSIPVKSFHSSHSGTVSCAPGFCRRTHRQHQAQKSATLRREAHHLLSLLPAWAGRAVTELPAHIATRDARIDDEGRRLPQRVRADERGLRLTKRVKRPDAVGAA
jgi:hypothetical protein